MRQFFSVVVPLAVAVAVVVPGPAHAATVNYVALGDSYSSGVGTDHYDLSSSCDRSSLAYPALVAAAKGYTLNFQACSGATTTDVINKQVAALNTSTTPRHRHRRRQRRGVRQPARLLHAHQLRVVDQQHDHLGQHPARRQARRDGHADQDRTRRTRR